MFQAETNTCKGPEEGNSLAHFAKQKRKAELEGLGGHLKIRLDR